MKFYFITIFLWVLFTNNSFSQNLVPNPGFEFDDGEYVSWKSVKGAAYWEIPRIGNQDLLYSKAVNQSNGYFSDWRFASVVYNKPMFGSAGQTTITPYAEAFEGNKALCLYTWLKKNPETRAYASVRLFEPLQKGKTYYVSLRITNGNNCVRRWVTNKLGIYFSHSYLIQPEDLSRIPVNPQLEISEIIYEKQWKQLTFLYTPDSDYQYLTIGNFQPADRIKIQEIPQDTFWQKFQVDYPYQFQGAFYFIDDVQVELFSAAKHQPKTIQSVLPTSLAETNATKNNSRRLLVTDWGDTLDTDLQANLEVASTELTLLVSDYAERD
ncbi:MAG: hypothetical protein NZ108_03450, partial [Bacteroidia bacterium]|nr:hypothetical protein [Bacteroidia bacterium]